MINVTQTTLDTINQSASISMTPKCWLEYNMNDLIDGVTVRGPNGTDAKPEGDLEVAKTASDGSTYKPFTKLFPIASIINPRRPQGSGIQYFILGDPSASKTITYSADKAYTTRMYLPGIKTAYKYWVTPKASGTSLSNCIISVNYPAAKTAAINKVTIKFESSHGLPATWSIKATQISGGELTIASNATVSIPSDGILNLYYNGTSWTTTEFISPSSPINISKLSLQINTVTVANGYIGIIEMSGRYVKDISDNLVSFNITKNASDEADGLLPVGNVTSNYSDYSFNFFDKSCFSYDKTYAFDTTKTNFYKDIIIRPFFQIGSENIKQGIYFLSEYSIDEFGNVSAQALDGAKELQEIFPPDIVIQESSSQSIVRRLLDSVGFTNYNFNKADPDTSSIRPYYWYTDNAKTVWQHIQDLCKDTQMIATFDENNILQFYTREYIFKNRTSDFKFRYDNKGLNLSNIIAMNSSDVPSVKTVKISYTPRLSSSYAGKNADDLYDAPVMILGAAALINSLPASATPEPDLNGTGAAPLGVVTLQPIVIDGYATKLNAYSGYLVINQEIIEYDAIKFHYMPVDESGLKYVWITSDSDISKFEGLSKPNTFAPDSQYRIKTRNAFGVLPAPIAHEVNTEKLKLEWSGRILDTKSGTSSLNNTKFTLDTIPAKNNQWSENFSQDVPRSMMTIFAPNTVSAQSTDKDGVVTTIYTDNNLLTMVSPNTIEQDFTNGPVNNYTNDQGSFASKNFVIGTSMYFPLLKTASGQDTAEQRTKGGIAFCLNEDNTSGYFLCINTSQNVTKDKNYRDITMYKIVAGKLVEMSDTQTNSGKSAITGISGGELYRVDIKVNETIKNGTERNLVFKIMFNNTTFAIHDKTPLTITKKIALCSYQGPVSYDYIYVKPISDSEYTQNQSYNLYQGYLGANSAIVKYFSDFVFSGKANVTDSPVWLKEFGPVAREIRRIQTRYYYSPGTPKYTQTILNPNVTVIGESLDSFSMDVFVMNNSGAFTELADGADKRFIVVGNYVLPKDPFEYVDINASEEDKKQGIAFESTWLQKESEAKSLHDWIKKQWSKQQRVVSIETFFNPLLKIGDVVEISYPSNNFYSSEDTGQTVGKYVIIEVSNSSDLNGTTSIKARSIYTE